MRDHIVIKGARENNLKNIDVEIPRDALVVMTGLSGSGKSSLAFDTIFAEGQRRYMESLSSYARQFLGQMDKPDVDSIEGMSPAISIDQKTTSKNPRSTVGTVTEIYDYLRLLWARVGVPHCPKCGKEIRRQTVDQIVDQIAALPQATRVQILAPVVRARKGEHQKVFDDARRGGYVRVRVDGSIYDLTETITLDKNRKHNIEIVVDRVVIRPDQNRRLTDAVEIASALSGGLVLADIPEEKREILFSQNYACDDCGISIEELTPRMFSFNSPYGACPTCGGLGTRLRIDPALIIPDPSKSILDGGITASGWNGVKDGCITTHWRKNITLTLQRPSATCRSTCARSCSMARGMKSSPCIMIPTAVPACCAARLRASSATLSAAIRRRRAMPCVHRSRTAWQRRPARTATARGCGRRCWPSRSAG